MKASSAAKTPAEYIASLDGARKAEIETLDAFIRKSVPSLTPTVMAGMLAYGPMHYVYATGREGDWFAVGLSSRKQYVSLYACAIVDGEYVAEKNKKKLPKADIGKSCIRFKKVEDIDFDGLKGILKETEAWWKAMPVKGNVRQFIQEREK